jgi:hypothetical protein
MSLLRFHVVIHDVTSLKGKLGPKVVMWSLEFSRSLLTTVSA